MIIDMGEGIAGKQNRPSLIIEAPPPPHTHTKIAKNIKFSHFDPYYAKLAVKCFPLLYMSQL